ncbi:MAG: helix-turn-helix transcriptional regulator [Clostridia bacterium]|nr:helix-turn-helix transcriptional regulator [Clostridia bacterium]
MPRKPNTTKARYNDPFPTRLRALMAETNITQEELCNVLNVKSRQSVTGYTDGSTIPTIDKIVALADYFGVSADYLLGLAEEKTRNTELRSVCEFTGLSERAINVIKSLKPQREGVPARHLELLNNIVSSESFKVFLRYFQIAKDFTEETQNSPYLELTKLNYDQDSSLESNMMLARYNAFECTQATIQLLNEVCNYEEVTEQAMSVLYSSRRRLVEEANNGEYQED